MQTAVLRNLCFLAGVTLATWSARAQSPMPPETFGDAELTSITFVDADAGWAVGERGVIWHTIDGGRNWQRQDSPTRSRLESVCFLDHEHGWAVGGTHTPYTQQSVGVVLHTVDGGRKWQTIPGLTLPALRHVKFLGIRQGVAVGESSPLFPGGVLTTSDGGRSWATVAAKEVGQTTRRRLDDGFTTGDFLSAQGGLVATSGAVGRVDPLELAVLQPPSMMRQPTALRLTREGVAWLCGRDGRVQRSSDGGASWLDTLPASTAPGAPSLHAMALVGDNLWVVGDPGSVVLHHRGGQWQQYRTGSNVPLNGLFFLDDKRGWAVGSLGTILATRDGGRSWRVQRQGGQRAALLVIASEPSQLPHEMIVQQAGHEGYLTAIEILTHDSAAADVQGRHAAAQYRHAVAKLLAAQVCVATQWPRPSHELHLTLDQLLATWGGPSALAEMERHVVARIRMWRPDVIVTQDAHPNGDNPLSHLTNQVVLSAVQKAADPTAYPEQISAWGLQEWKIKKVFAAASGNHDGDLKLICTQLAPRLGASLADVADEARGQLDSTYVVAPATRGFSLLIDHLPPGQGKRDFFSGIALTPGGEARRSLSNPPIPDFAALTKQIQKRQLLLGLIQRSEKDPLRGAAWLAQMHEMTKGLPAPVTARVMYHLGERYQTSGESELAADVMNSLVEKHPEHPLSDKALLWLLNYYASGETAHRQQGKSPLPAPVVEVAEPEVAGEVRAASANLPVDNGRSERAVAVGKLLEKNRPALYAEEAVRYTLATARSAPAASLERERHMQSMASAPGSGGWAECAQAELWITGKNRGACPLPHVVCKQAARKPKLDGRLDDDVWQGASAVSLRETEGATPLDSIVALTYDEEFLYLAVSCQRHVSGDNASDDRVRPRDADLSRHDRVELLLDIDRDYATSYQLAVDHRGWASESCYGDPSWNPNWFIAAGGDDTHWTVEAAIPVAELTRDTALAKASWAASFRRVIPSSHVQRWTTSSHGPGRFGLLQFE